MKVFRFVLLLLLFVLVLQPVFGRQIIIKIGSPTPANTIWGKALNDLAEEWYRISGGEVVLKLYHGTAGTEDDMIGKMKFGSLQGVVLTSWGLNHIAPDSLVVSMPLLIRNDEEFFYALKKVDPLLKSKIIPPERGDRHGGFNVLAWTLAGWMKFFAKKPVSEPEDLKKLKLATSASDPNMYRAWVDLGYNVEPVTSDALAAKLSSGAIEAVYFIPLATILFFQQVPYMTDMKIAPVLGGIVLAENAWSKIPDKYKPQFQESIDRMVEDLNRSTAKLEADKIAEMESLGLKPVSVPPASQEKWINAFKNATQMIMGKSFSQEIYDTLNNVLEEYRKTHGK
ncbi:MAG: TRAP transporter substrate-binding protein DctP [Spirochaetota bacterium]